jgi:hypothetical protein
MRSCYIIAQLRERQRSETPRRTSNTAKASHLQQHHHILVDNDLLVMERNSSHSRVWRLLHNKTSTLPLCTWANTWVPIKILFQVLLLRERGGREAFGGILVFPPRSQCVPPNCSQWCSHHVPQVLNVFTKMYPSKDFYTSFGRSMTSSTHITLNPKPYLLLPWHL